MSNVISFKNHARRISNEGLNTKSNHAWSAYKFNDDYQNTKKNEETTKVPELKVDKRSVPKKTKSIYAKEPSKDVQFLPLNASIPKEMTLLGAMEKLTKGKK